MRTRLLARGSREVYNARLRVRLAAAADGSHQVVTIFFLRPNGFYYRKLTLRVGPAVHLAEVIEHLDLL